MPFRGAQYDTANRYREVQNLLNIIVANEIKRPLPPEQATIKGLFIVALYGFMEYSLGRLTQSAIQHLNSLNVKKKHLHAYAVAAACDNLFKSLRDSRGEKNYMRRLEVMDAITDDALASVDEGVFAEFIQNTYPSTFALIERTFYIELQELKNPKIAAYIREITENRNAVAHGRESPLTVGGRFTGADLSDRASAINQLLAELTSAFSGDIADPQFIRKAARRRYAKP